MELRDNCCSLDPYFKIHEGKIDAFKNLCEKFVEKTKEEKDCMYYGFTFDGDQVHCREGYSNAEGLLAHLDNVGPILGEALKIADITRLEIHGPKTELQKLREPLKGLSPQYWELEYGFRHG